VPSRKARINIEIRSRAAKFQYSQATRGEVLQKIQPPVSRSKISNRGRGEGYSTFRRLLLCKYIHNVRTEIYIECRKSNKDNA